MTFERRNFLKLLGLGATATALGKISSVWVNEDLYVNRRLGLRFRKPYGWLFLSVREMSAMRDEQQLLCIDDEFLQELKDEIGLPLVSINRSVVQEETGPQVHVWVQPNDDEDFSVVETHRFTYSELYGPLLRDFTFEKPPAPVSFIGHDASECVVRFRYEGTSGFTAQVRLRSIFFPRGKVSYTINMADNANEGWDEEVTEAFESVLASVEFVHFQTETLA
jgi:hypothetical protein